MPLREFIIRFKVSTRQAFRLAFGVFRLSLLWAEKLNETQKKHTADTSSVKFIIRALFLRRFALFVSISARSPFRDSADIDRKRRGGGRWKPINPI